MIELVVMEYTFTQMELFMKASGLTIIKKELDVKPGMTNQASSGIMPKEKNKE